MQNKQRGMGVLGLLTLLVGIVLVAVLGMKVGPAYIEYFTVKKMVADIANSGESSPQEIRASFQRRAQIEYFDDISANDLIIGKDELGFAYEKRIPLIGNLTLLIDFEGYSQRNIR